LLQLEARQRHIGGADLGAVVVEPRAEVVETRRWPAAPVDEADVEVEVVDELVAAVAGGRPEIEEGEEDGGVEPWVNIIGRK